MSILKQINIMNKKQSSVIAATVLITICVSALRIPAFADCGNPKPCRPTQLCDKGTAVTNLTDDISLAGKSSKKAGNCCSVFGGGPTCPNPIGGTGKGEAGACPEEGGGES